MERRTLIKAGVIGAAVGATGGWSRAAMADYDGLPPDKDGLLVFIADGIYDPIAALSGPTGEDFDRDVMGRTPAEAAAWRADALAFFDEEYGVSFSMGKVQSRELIPGFPAVPVPVDDDERAFLVYTQLPPAANYRAIMVGGDNARDGLTVHDANYAVVIDDPAGTTLTGRWGGGGGRLAAPGSALVFGEYLVQTRKPNPVAVGLPGYRISWTSFDPVTMMAGFSWPENRFLFDCRMFSDDFGEGVALGRNETRLLPDGRVQQMIRNVISFPADEFYAGR